MKNKPVLLIFIDWFSPGYKAGGPIASCLNFINLMKDAYHLYVFTSDTDLGETKPYDDIMPDTWIMSTEHSCMVYYASKKRLNAKYIRKAIAYLNPDFVYLNHLFSPWFVIYPLWLKKRGIIKGKVIVCPRGALYESALSIKRYKKGPFLFLFKGMNLHKLIRFHATSEREQEAIKIFFPGSEVLIGDDLPGLSQPPFKPILKEPGFLNCIFIARIHPIKNLHFLLEALVGVKAQITLTIIGPVEDEEYWQRCKTLLISMPANITSSYKGALPNHALASFMQEHHLFILPTKGENFGHSIFESMQAGRPVLISDQTPWLKLKQICVGWDLPLGQPEYFVSAIETAAAWNQHSFETWGQHAWQYAKDFVDGRGLKQQYLKLFS